MEREVGLPNYLVHDMPYGMWVTTGGPIPYECAYSHRVDRCVDNSMQCRAWWDPNVSEYTLVTIVAHKMSMKLPWYRRQCRKLSH